ncbi:hypothetical protein O181_058477 [Austropuccinia psidii MF-1]|uniref:Uncharacterized protein n=1 Tax=Austropuccinia psidii MF-1 TaxID=1389203 RepID=A0A9Q3EJU3_9BASI|nr:hypothetical protein [Austropuccinia psidii MF-1]
MRPQPEGHSLENTYHQEDIKPDALLVNKARSPSQYQDGYNMSYSEKEALRQLPEASSWTKLSGTGEYDHMELIDYIDGLFIAVSSIPDYWITAMLKTEFKGHDSILVYRDERNPWKKKLAMVKESNYPNIQQWYLDMEKDHVI